MLRTGRRKLKTRAEPRPRNQGLRCSGRGGGERGRLTKFAIPGEDNPDAPESPRRWNMERRNCYKGFGSFGWTKPPTTPVGVMRPVTPHSGQGCRQNLAARRMGGALRETHHLSKRQLMGIAYAPPILRATTVVFVHSVPG